MLDKTNGGSIMDNKEAGDDDIAFCAFAAVEA
jgi:hypothetical protein